MVRFKSAFCRARSRAALALGATQGRPPRHPRTTMVKLGRRVKRATAKWGREIAHDHRDRSLDIGSKNTRLIFKGRAGCWRRAVHAQPRVRGYGWASR